MTEVLVARCSLNIIKYFYIPIEILSHSIITVLNSWQQSKLRLAAGKTLGARSLASINPLSSIESATSGFES